MIHDNVRNNMLQDRDDKRFHLGVIVIRSS